MYDRGLQGGYPSPPPWFQRLSGYRIVLKANPKVYTNIKGWSKPMPVTEMSTLSGVSQANLSGLYRTARIFITGGMQSTRSLRPLVTVAGLQ